MTERPAQLIGLIQLLLDLTADFGERHDAGMELGGFDDESAENALAKVACDQNADRTLADICGESLAEMWCRNNRISESVLVNLVPAALQVALATIRQCSAELENEADQLLRRNQEDGAPPP